MVFSGSLYLFQDGSNSETGVLAASFPAIGGLQSNLGIIQEEISEIKESTLRTEKLVESIAEDSKENIKQFKDYRKEEKNTNSSRTKKLYC